MRSYFTFELSEITSRGKPVFRIKTRPFTSLTEGQLWQSANRLTEMANWCQTNSCGRRTSYDHFDFRSEAERNIFLLRWG